MLTKKGPSVLEFNVRLGDPETQPLLSRLRSDFIEIAERTLARRLAGTQLSWDSQHAVAVVAASEGYPGKCTTGLPISGLDSIRDDGVKVYHSGTKLGPSGEILTAGGRVLAVTALGPDRAAARARAYAALSKIHFKGMHHRTDIGAEGR
jgi:phosphoribosylamine--glycine ligase